MLDLSMVASASSSSDRLKGVSLSLKARSTSSRLAVGFTPLSASCSSSVSEVIMLLFGMFLKPLSDGDVQNSSKNVIYASGFV